MMAPSLKPRHWPASNPFDSNQSTNCCSRIESIYPNEADQRVGLGRRSDAYCAGFALAADYASLIRPTAFRPPFVHSANQFIVVGMRADPEPEIAAVHLDGECTIAQADADGPVTSD